MSAADALDELAALLAAENDAIRAARTDEIVGLHVRKAALTARLEAAEPEIADVLEAGGPGADDLRARLMRARDALGRNARLSARARAAARDLADALGALTPQGGPPGLYDARGVRSARRVFAGGFDKSL